MVGARGWGGADRESVFFVSMEFQFGEDEKVPEMGGGLHCKANVFKTTESHT